MQTLNFETLVAGFERARLKMYGEDRVTEMEHLLQCGDLALADHADDDLALAAILHDIGRFVVPQQQVSDTTDPRLVQQGPQAVASDARGHHEVGANLIAPFVSERAAWCVRKHADAKRYLCATDPAYFGKLSDGSRRTMVLQGGIMTADEVREFETQPWYQDAVRLRIWDDEAKVPNKETRPLEFWLPKLEPLFSGHVSV